MTEDRHATCPYRGLPPSSNWRLAMGDQPADAFDPGVERPFRIGKSDAIATAGSCFAQNVSRALSDAGYGYLVTEPAPSGYPPELLEGYNYGVFTARYANIYTARQLRQMVDRAYGRFTPADQFWDMGDHVVDPFRPFIQPGGFSTERELQVDREFHFHAVRTMLKSLDVFVFTLGLTECWEDTCDGAIYGGCPGCGAGRHDPDRHRFVNLTVDDVVRDMNFFLRALRRINPDARMILTVSPAPLIATMEPRHVLASTVHSKSVLRVAADLIQKQNANVSYFPSYEIVSAPFHGNRYFQPDRRQVTQEAVDHVMRVFLRHYADDSSTERVSGAPFPVIEEVAQGIVRTVCDEEMLDVEPFPGGAGRV